jgi:hypothetical protein
LITVVLAVTAALLVSATSTNAEFGPATTIHPDAAFIGSPSLAFDARGTAPLPDHTNAPHVSGIGCAVMAPTVIGGAVDRIAALLVSLSGPVAAAPTVPANLKVGTTAAINPDSVPGVSPGLTLNAF